MDSLIARMRGSLLHSGLGAMAESNYSFLLDGSFYFYVLADTLGDR